MSVEAAVSVTQVAARAVQAAGESTVQDVYPLLADHWWVGALLVALRLAQPVLFAAAQKTQTRWDDKLVRGLAWLLGAVARQAANDKKPTTED